MTEQRDVEVGLKLYLNGFPKAGTHALDTMAKVVLPKLTKDNWLGNMANYAFTDKLAPVDVPRALDEFLPGRYVRGHMAYRPELPEAFQRNAICKVFIFRDFRDVAVSATYHAIKKGNTFPKKEYYESLPFDELLKVIITGDGFLAGVMQRWELFAPWLDEDWVLKIAFEDFIEHPEGVAELFLRYLYGKTGSYMGAHIELDPETFQSALKRIMWSIKHPEKSITFRKGKIGGWKEHFTEEHKALFKASDKNNWLIKLGYENDRNW